MFVDPDGPKGFGRLITVEEARRYIISHFNKSLSNERVRQILHEEGLVQRVPTYSFTRASPTQQKEFVEDYKELMERKEIQSGETIVLFHDETTVREHPTRTTVWSEKGHRPVVLTSGQHQKMHFSGVLNPKTGETYSTIVSGLNSDCFCQFLRELHTRYPNQRIHVILDGHRIHTSKQTKKFIDQNASWLEVSYLPPYSPNLNPVEQLWRWMKEKVVHNRFYRCFGDL